jgi:hypothetical protein
MEQLADALAPFGSPNLVAAVGSARRPDVRPAEPGPSSTFLDSSQDTPPERRSSRLWTGVALLAAAVLVTLAAGLRFGGHLLAPSARERPAAAPPVATPTAVPVVSSPGTVQAPGGTPSSAATSAPAATPHPSTRPSSATHPRPTRTPMRPAPTQKRGVSKDLGF